MVLSVPVAALNLDHFGDQTSQTSVILTGQVNNTSILLPSWAEINTISFQGRGKPIGTSYPGNFSLDLGNSSEAEWGWGGAGSGSLGQQSLFRSGKFNEVVLIEAGSNDSSISLLLPNGANLEDSTLTIRGGDNYTHRITNVSEVEEDDLFDLGGNLIVGGFGEDDRALIRFPPRDIPTDAVIVKATLWYHVYVVGEAECNETDLEVFKPNGSWTDHDADSSVYEPNGTYYNFSLSAFGAGGYVAFSHPNLTSAYYNWSNGSENLGIGLRFTDFSDDCQLIFQNHTSAEPPYLDLTFIQNQGRKCHPRCR